MPRFRPKATGFAAMYHKVVDVPDAARPAIRVLVNCRDERGLIRSIVPDETRAAHELVAHLLATGRRRIAFLNLPGLVAGAMRLEGFRQAHRDAGLAPRDHDTGRDEAAGFRLQGWGQPPVVQDA